MGPHEAETMGDARATSVLGAGGDSRPASPTKAALSVISNLLIREDGLAASLGRGRQTQSE